ncbi:MAG TPA: hypothetical protein VGD64_07855 [Acidisarcina sp.]
MLDNVNDVPPDEFAQLPAHRASEHDHYLYESPKKINETHTRQDAIESIKSFSKDHRLSFGTTTIRELRQAARP